MNLRKFISGVSALAIAASAFAGLAVTANAAVGDEVYNYSITDLVDTTTGDALAEDSNTHATFYVADSKRVSFNSNKSSNVTINFNRNVDISGGENGDDVTITFGLNYIKDGNSKATRTLNFRYKDGENTPTNSMPSVINYNYGDVYFGNTNDTKVVSMSKNATTDFTINIYSKDGKRYAKMTCGTTSSSEQEVTGTYINQLYLTTSSSNISNDRLLHVDNLNFKSTEAATDYYAATFTANDGAITPEVKVYSDEERTSLAEADRLLPGTYWYTAKLRGYNDATGSFIITNADYPVSFTMTPKESAGAVTVKYKIDGSDPAEYIADDYKPSVAGYFEGETLNVPYQRYINYNGTLYQRTGTTYGSSTYGKDITLTAGTKTENFPYTATEIEDVKYYSEGENVTDASVYSIGNAAARSSNRAVGYSSEYVNLCNLPAGVYKLTAAMYAGSSGGVTIDFKYGDSETEKFSLNNSGSSNGVEKSQTFTLYTDSGIQFKGGGWNGNSSSAASGLDYVYIVKISDLPATARLTSVTDVQPFRMGSDGEENAVTAAILNITVANQSTKIDVTYNNNTQTSDTKFVGSVMLGVIVPGIQEGLTTNSFTVAAHVD